jgi:hypothetical protein
MSRIAITIKNNSGRNMGEKLFEVVYEDADLLVINKPAGLVCHPTKGDKYSSLISRVRLYLGKELTPQLVNRLDRFEKDLGKPPSEKGIPGHRAWACVRGEWVHRRSVGKGHSKSRRDQGLCA